MSARPYFIAGLAILLLGGAAVAQMGPGQGAGRPDAPWRQRLEAIDENGDGRISKAEAAANAEAVFAAMDADSNGRLTRDEYMAVRMGAQQGWNKARQAERQAQKEARFAPMDTDHDGTVSAAEFAAGAAARFTAADRDHDGFLVPAEFRGHNF